MKYSIKLRNPSHSPDELSNFIDESRRKDPDLLDAILVECLECIGDEWDVDERQKGLKVDGDGSFRVGQLYTSFV